MTDRELLQQALEALENFARFQRMMMDGPDVSDKLLAEDYAEAGFLQGAKTITALRERLSQEPNMPEQYIMVGRFMLQPHPQNGYWLTDTGTSEAMQIFQPEMEQVIKKLWSQF